MDAGDDQANQNDKFLLPGWIFCGNRNSTDDAGEKKCQDIHKKHRWGILGAKKCVGGDREQQGQEVGRPSASSHAISHLEDGETHEDPKQNPQGGAQRSLNIRYHFQSPLMG